MKLKAILTAVLSALVAVSLAIVVAGWISDGVRMLGSAVPESGPSRAASAFPAASDSPVAPHRVIVYYFHGNVRCAGCNKIEAYSREAVERGFPRRRRDGRLLWRAVNYDRRENKHFIKRYRLIAPAVVLVAMDGQKPVRSRTLTEVWDLTGDKKALIDYVRREARAFVDRFENGSDASGANHKAGKPRESNETGSNK